MIHLQCEFVASVIHHPALPPGFPLLGPEYPLDSAAAAFNVALLTECFGFGSGLIGYSAGAYTRSQFSST